MHALRLLWAAHNEEVWLRRQRRNISRRALEEIAEMPDMLFIERFRLDKTSFRNLCSDLRIHAALKGTREISVEVKVLCTLSFLATGSYQRIVGVTQYLPQRTASRCIRQVVEALNNQNIISKWIVFPQTREQRSRIRQEFQRKFRLPGVIGCIDCTHIAIIKPNDEEHIYFNRKGYHSLNVQMICDQNLNILNVNARYGGATHDSFIWASSLVEAYMRELHQSGEQTWLLGDSGYPLRPWLMTPILNATPGTPEEIYTTRHDQAWNCIERCFGLLKARWRCLLKHQTLHYHPHVASKIIHACCVLHNIALANRIQQPSDATEHQDNDNDTEMGPSISNSQDDELMHGRSMLSGLIRRL